MIKNQDERSRAIDDLIENVKAQNFIPEEGNPAYTLTNGKQFYMPAYVPYVGPEYFQNHPRILCYAINQNLSKHRSWSDIWMREWSLDQMCAINRLNRAAECGRAIPIKPYAEGFIPLAAILCILAYTRRSSAELPSNIDAVVSVTNFVKFSKSDNASSSDIPNSWWHESGSRYVRHEIEILQPDLIVTFGKRTYMELARVLSDTNYQVNKPQIRECRFPGRIPSEKARPVRGNEKDYWIQDILPLTSRIEPPLKSFVTWRMTRFPGYFLDIAKAWNLL